MSLKQYHFGAKVLKQVLDRVTLSVRAGSSEEAEAIAESFLNTFPDPSENGDSVPFAYIEDREYLSSQMVGLEKRVRIRDG